ncbi:hypothetical protein Tco_1542354 [Tanacetum coccineum]
MRSKRTIKPTKIFNNSVSSTGRNSNKHKIMSKKSIDKNVNVNGTVEYDGDSESMSNNQMKFNGEVRGDSLNFEENVVGVSTKEETKETEKENIEKRKR